MKALTIWQPWASLIMGTCTLSEDSIADGFTLPKDVENRTWPSNHRGELLIHAGKRVDKEWMYLIEEKEVPTGVILGVVEMRGYTIDSESPWAAKGKYHWEMESPQAFAEPIPYKGAQGLFEVPNSVIAEAIAKIGGIHAPTNT